MRIIGRLLIGLFVIILIVVAAAGGAFVYFTRQSFPQTSGTIKLLGLSGEVEVIRDSFGVPHIYADTPADLFRAQGFVHAQDRFFQMEFWRRIGQGRLAELFGESALTQDKYIRTWGWPRVAAEEAAALDPDVKAVLEAYAEGVNAYALNNADKLGFEFKVLGLIGRKWTPEPWLPVHSIAWGKVMSWGLSDNMDAEMLRAALISKGGPALADALLPAYPDDMPVIVPSASAKASPVTTANLPAISPRSAIAVSRAASAIGNLAGFGQGSDIGSNNWVVAGTRTISGKPLLANDPHLGIQMPSIWYQVGLHCRKVDAACPYDVVGFSFAGTPGVVIGHNARIAWGVTNGTVDTQDMFIEKANPANPDEFEYMGKFEPAKIYEEKINVAGKAEPVTIKVRVTRHGPISNDIEKDNPNDPPMALSWATLKPGHLMRAIIKLNTAQNWDGFRNALRDWSAPAQNFVYADVDGNIGYQLPGEIPIRKNGDGTVPAQGWTGENEWTGFIAFDDLPTRYNPPEGFIATANNAIVDAKYPHLLMARDMDHGWRARRIVEMLNSKPKFSVEDIEKMQFDAQSPFADDVLETMAGVLEQSSDNMVQTATQALKSWDKRYTRDSVGALIFEKYWLRAMHLAFDDVLGDDLRDAVNPGSEVRVGFRALMNDANSPWWDDTTTPAVETREIVLRRAFADVVNELKTKFGADVKTWQWGKLHVATFPNETLGESGIDLIERIFNRGPYPAEGGTALVNAVGHRETLAVRTVPSMRMIVDLNDLSRSKAVHTTGQSGHTFNPHYDDMIPLWLNGEYNPLLWTRDDVDKNSAGRLVLTP